MATFMDMFNELSDRLSRSGNIETISASFAQKSTDIERMCLAFDLPDVVKEMKAKSVYRKKCAKEADNLRCSGNKSFQKSDYDKALSFYTVCIMSAPVGSQDLGLGYANRSAVLFRLGRYDLCLRDIRRSLANSYPDDLRYKLLERRARCHSREGENTLAVESYEEAKRNLEVSILRNENRTKLRNEINREMEELVTNTNANLTEDLKHSLGDCLVPSIDGDCSSMFPCASNAFSISYDKYKGRYPVASRDISAGEVVIVEKPYCSVLFTSFHKTHCHHCCQRVLCGVPCSKCSSVLFCDEQCHDDAWNAYHYAECKFLVFLEQLDMGMAVLALRIVIQTGIKKILDNSAMDVTTHGAFNRDRVYDSHDYRAVFELVNHDDARTVADLFRRTTQAVLFLNLLKQTDFFACVSPKKKSTALASMYTVVGSDLLRHIMMLPCNAHEITEYTHDARSESTYTNTEIGSGLYNTLSLINHSCDPSLVRHSYGNICVARAIRQIKQGDEICDNYGVLYATSDVTERQSHLRTQYYFNCICTPCTENWDTFFNLPQNDRCYKCQDCEGDMAETGRAENEYVCGSCDAERDLSVVIDSLNVFAKEYSVVLDEVLAGKESRNHLPILLAYLETMDKHVRRPWKQYNECQETIKQVYSALTSNLS